MPALIKKLQNLEPCILAIESSCDDTSCAVLHGKKVLSNIIASQAIHARYGGVVPELASRDHQKNILPVIDTAMKEAGIERQDIDAIAVTRGPGLMGSLLVGLSVAKSMALALDVPLIEVHHMQAHILSHFIKNKDQSQEPTFPFICLTVSGGHTQLVRVTDHLQFEVLGETLDDAVGEGFDKAAKIMGLPYPGGPLIDKHAKDGDPTKFEFAMSKVPGLDYSFSGIKTSFLYFIQNNLQKDPDFVTKNLADICASYQSHLVNVLLKNVERALEETGIKTLALAGGVSANSELRRRVYDLGKQKEISVFIPPFEFCTDNAAMIGIVGYYKFLRNDFADLSLTPMARMSL